MISYDEFCTDPLGANEFLAQYFDTEDLTNEIAHQVLAQKWFEELDIWDME